MALSEVNRGVSMAIDQAIRFSQSTDEEFEELAMIEFGFSYAQWYAVLLTNLTLLVGSSEIVHAQANTVDEAVDIALFTETLVIAGRIDDVQGPGRVSSLRAVPRSAIRSLEVDASMPINEHQRLIHGWPGRLSLTAVYESLPSPLNVRGPSLSTSADDRVSTIWKVADHLRSDLQRLAKWKATTS